MAEKKDKKKKQKIVQAPINTNARTKKWIYWGVLCLMTLVVVFLSLFWTPGEMHYEIGETYLIPAGDVGALHLAILLPLIQFSQLRMQAYR